MIARGVFHHKYVLKLKNVCIFQMSIPYELYRCLKTFAQIFLFFFIEVLGKQALTKLGQAQFSLS